MHHRSSLKIKLNLSGHIFRGDHVEAFGNAQFGRQLDRLFTNIGAVLGITITHKLTATFPASPCVATWEHLSRRNVLVMWVSLPLRWFTTARDDHTRSLLRTSGSSFDSRRKMHGERDGANDPFRM